MFVFSGNEESLCFAEFLDCSSFDRGRESADGAGLTCLCRVASCRFWRVPRRQHGEEWICHLINTNWKSFIQVMKINVQCSIWKIESESRDRRHRLRVFRGVLVGVACEVVVVFPRAYRAEERRRNLAECRFECWECRVTRNVRGFERPVVADADMSDLSYDEVSPVDRANRLDTSDRHRGVLRCRYRSMVIEERLHFASSLLRPMSVQEVRRCSLPKGSICVWTTVEERFWILSPVRSDRWHYSEKIQIVFRQGQFNVLVPQGYLKVQRDRSAIPERMSSSRSKACKVRSWSQWCCSTWTGASQSDRIFESWSSDASKSRFLISKSVGVVSFSPRETSKSFRSLQKGFSYWWCDQFFLDTHSFVQRIRHGGGG